MSRTLLLPDTPNVEPAVFRDRFADTDVTIVTVEAGDSSQLEDAPDAHGIVVHANTPVTESVLEAHPDLEIVARIGTGVENIDIVAAAEHEIPVTNVPNYSNDEVATHALSLLLAARRHLVGHDLAMRDGEWDWTNGAPAPRMTGSTVGVVSFGAIARRFVRLLEGFDTEVVVYDPYVDDETVEEEGARRVEFDELLERADAVSIHAPLTDETRGLFDAEVFERLPYHAVVVNAGRGGIVDEDALNEALEAGEIAAAGLDVFAEEPPTGSPLIERDDVICTPHAAWYSEESKQELNETAAANVAAAFAGDSPPNAIDPDAAWIG